MSPPSPSQELQRRPANTTKFQLARSDFWLCDLCLCGVLVAGDLGGCALRRRSRQLAACWSLCLVFQALGAPHQARIHPLDVMSAH